MGITNLERVLIILLPVSPFIIYGIAWGLNEIIEKVLWKIKK